MSPNEYATAMVDKYGTLTAILRCQERVVKYSHQYRQRYAEALGVLDAQRYVWWATVGGVIGKRINRWHRIDS